VMSIVTDSRRPDEPKDPETCNVFRLYRLLVTPEESADVAARYRAGGIGYREAKELVVDAHERRFGDARRRHGELMDDTAALRRLLRRGADRARDSSRELLDAARHAVGLGREHAPVPD
jgi:tryptophanyl-tRNA synthetase